MEKRIINKFKDIFKKFAIMEACITWIKSCNKSYIKKYILKIFIVFFVFVGLIYTSLFLALIITSEISDNYWPRSVVLEQPWNQSNLTFFIDNKTVDKNNVDIYSYNARLSFKWWESKGYQYLDYKINFSETNESANANIIINWALENYTTNNDINGHTFINSGPKCNTSNPPFTQCNISIKRGLENAKMQNVITHEIGHTFTLTHSFNTWDFLAFFFGRNYLNTPKDIMIDEVVIGKAYFLMLSLLAIILLMSILIMFKYNMYMLKKLIIFTCFLLILGYFNLYNIYIEPKYVANIQFLFNFVVIEILILYYWIILHFPDFIEMKIE